jgi:HD-like signal output (HDOD) protein
MQATLPRDTDMASPERIRSLKYEIPTPPAALLQLAALLAQPAARVDEMAALIESDMALAAALLKTVNSSLFGLAGTIRSVRQAITYLGSRQVAELTQLTALRSAFPAAAQLQPMWQRSARRAALMGRIGQALDIAPWDCHSAGLFEEAGKALLFRHATARYRTLLAAAADDEALARLEQEAFGASHDAVGAALCETWGLAPAAVHSVRHRLRIHADLRLPAPPEHQGVCAVAALARVSDRAPQQLDAACHTLALQRGREASALLQATLGAQAVRPAADRVAS